MPNTLCTEKLNKIKHFTSLRVDSVVVLSTHSHRHIWLLVVQSSTQTSRSDLGITRVFWSKCLGEVVLVVHGWGAVWLCLPLFLLSVFVGLLFIPSSRKIVSLLEDLLLLVLFVIVIALLLSLSSRLLLVHLSLSLSPRIAVNVISWMTLWLFMCNVVLLFGVIDYFWANCVLSPSLHMYCVHLDWCKCDIIADPLTFYMQSCSFV